MKELCYLEFCQKSTIELFAKNVFFLIYSFIISTKSFIIDVWWAPKAKSV